MKVYKIYIEKTSERREYHCYNTMSWINSALGSVLDQLEKSFPIGNFMKVWTGNDRQSFILFTDVKDNLYEIRNNFIIRGHDFRPELGKVRIELIEGNLSNKKAINILSHQDPFSDYYIDSSTYKFGPKRKQIFFDKKFWCRLAKHYDRISYRS